MSRLGPRMGRGTVEADGPVLGQRCGSSLTLPSRPPGAKPGHASGDPLQPKYPYRREKDVPLTTTNLNSSNQHLAAQNPTSAQFHSPIAQSRRRLDSSAAARSLLPRNHSRLCTTRTATTNLQRQHPFQHLSRARRAPMTRSLLTINLENLIAGGWGRASPSLPVYSTTMK